MLIGIRGVSLGNKSIVFGVLAVMVLFLSSSFALAVSLDFGFTFYVGNETGGPLAGANVTISKFIMIPNVPPTEDVLNSTLSLGDGWANFSGIPKNDSWSYKLKIVYYNGSGIATKIGPILPPLPHGLFDGSSPISLNGSTLLTQPAATINITAVSNSTLQEFGYEVFDVDSGYPLESYVHGTDKNYQVIVPVGRDYIVMVNRNPDVFGPILVAQGACNGYVNCSLINSSSDCQHAGCGWDQEVCHPQGDPPPAPPGPPPACSFNSSICGLVPGCSWNTTGYQNICNGSFFNDSGCPMPPKSDFMNITSTGSTNNIQFTLGVANTNLYGCIDVQGNHTPIIAITDVVVGIIPYPGLVPSSNAGQINVSDPSQIHFQDPHCPGKLGFYNFSNLMDTHYMFQFYGSNETPGNPGETMAAYLAVMMDSSTKVRNITLIPMIGDWHNGTELGDFASQKVRVNILDSSGQIANGFAGFIDLVTGTPENGRMIYIIQPTNATFYIPLTIEQSNNSWAKLNILGMGPPIEKYIPIDPSTKEINVTMDDGPGFGFRKMTSSGYTDMNVSQENVTINFLMHSPECNVIDPPSNCELGSFNAANFNPLALDYPGKVNMRLHMPGTGITLTYMNYDLFAARAPTNSIFGESPDTTNVSALWKFGSFVPSDSYANVIITVPYSDTQFNDSAGMNVSIPYLYDENMGVVWNKTRGDNISNLTYQYTAQRRDSDYNSSEFSGYLTSAGVPCNATDANTSSFLCNINTTSNIINIRVPHFSSIAPQINGQPPQTGPPTIYLVAPGNNQIFNATGVSVDVTFNVTAVANAGAQLANCTLYTNISGSWLANQSSVLTGQSNSTSWSISNVSIGNYRWNAYCCDNSSNCTFNSQNYTFSIVDSISPTVILTSPVDGIYTNSTDVLINFTATDNNPANLTCVVYRNGNNVSTWSVANGTSHNNTEVGQPEGTYSYYVNCSDYSGNSNVSSTNTIVIDTTNPSINIVSPVMGQNLSSRTIQISLVSTDANMNYTNITIYNSTGGIANSTTNTTNGTYSVNLSVPADGQYVINATAYDLVGRTNSSAVNVSVDSILPTVVLTSPVDGTRTNSSNVFINFTATDNIATTLTCKLYRNGFNFTRFATNGTPYTETFVFEPEGTDSYYVNCSDYSGNYNISNINTIVIDTMAPTTNISLAGTIGLSGWYVSAVTINLTCNDSFGMNSSGVGCNTTYYNLTTNSNYAVYSIPIAALYGVNTIFYYSTDNVSNTESPKNSTIKLDNVKPAYVAYNTSATQVNTSDSIIVWANWTEDYPLNATLYVNGAVNSTLNVTYTNFSWTAPANLAEQNVTFFIKMYDQAGNWNQTGNMTVYVRDTAAPVVGLVTPGNLTSTNNATVVFRFNATDNLNFVSNCTLLIGGNANQTNTTFASGAISSFNPVVFANGNYNWSVLCYDNSGNPGQSALYYFTIDTMVPTVILTSPVSGVTNNSSVFINFTATDNIAASLNCTLYMNGGGIGTWSATNGIPYTTTEDGEPEGNNSYYVNCSDYSGNYNVSSTSTVFIDTTAPTTNISLAGTTGLSGWYISTTTINLTCSDGSGVGCNKTYYNLTTNSDYVVYSAPIAALYGVNTIFYYSTDNASNAESPKNYTVKIDNVYPAYVAYNTSASQVNTSDSITVWANWTENYPLNATLYVNGAVNSTLLNMTYANFSWTAPANLAEQNVTFFIRMYDQAGNWNQTGPMVVYVRDTTGPVVNLVTLGNLTLTNNNTVIFRFNATDNLNSVSNCTLLIGGNANQTNTTFASGAISSFNAIGFNDGSYNWSVNCFDGSGNLGSSPIYYFTIDTIAPKYYDPVAYPTSPAVYSPSQTYYFNITFNDTVQIGSVGINFSGIPHQATNISQTYMFNVTGLNASTYYYTWLANDTVGNMNSTAALALNYTVIRANATCSLILTPPTSVVYNGTVNVSCFCANNNEAPAQLLRNSTNVTVTENNLNVVLGAGTYNYTCIVPQTLNYNAASNTSLFQVNQTTPQLFLTETHNWNLTYGSAVNVNCFANTAQVQPRLYRNGADLNATVDTATLGAGNYTYVCNNTATQNYTAAANSSNLSVAKANDNLTLILNGAQNQNTSIIYPASVTANGTSSSGTHTIYKNGTLIAPGVPEVLGGGLWEYKINSTGNQNYTVDSTGKTYYVLVNKTSSGVNLSLNGNASNITVNVEQTVNITGTRLLGENNIVLYADGVLINNGTSLISNVTSYSTEGSHNITLVYYESANYSMSSQTYWITVIDNVPPVVNLTSPSNDVWNTTTSQVLVYYVNDTHSGIQNCSLYFDSVLKLTNSSVTEGVNLFNYNTTGGSHTWYVRCYDNSSQKNTNASQQWILKIDGQAPTTSILGVFNESYGSNVSFTFSASDSGDSGLNRTEYNLTGACSSGWADYTTAVSCGNESSTTVYYRSIDNAGNVEIVHALTFSIDKTGPSVNITSPSNGANVSGAIYLNATAVDSGVNASHVVFMIDSSQIADDASAPFSTSVLTTSYGDGNHTLTATAYDAVGNHNSTNVTVFVDNTKPNSSIVYPANNYLTKNSVNVNGTAADAGVGVLFVEVYNGTGWNNATLNAGVWNYTVSFPASGTYNIKSRATDKLGNQETAGAGINVIYDVTVPTISGIVVNPNPSASAANVTVSATVTDANGVSLVNATLFNATFNGTSVTLSNVGGNSYSGQMTSPAAEGLYNVTILAIDNATNVALNSAYQLSVNTSVPIISITPVSGVIIANGTTVTISVANAQSSYYNTSANSTPIYFNGSVQFAAAGADDNYTVYVWANTSLGVNATKTNTYTIDNVAPAITLNAVTAITGTTTQNITGFVNETNLNYVTVNGMLADLNGNNFSKVVSLSEGNNTISIAAYDGAGHSATNTTYIFLDTVTPVTNHTISGTSGENGWYTSNVIVTLTASDGSNSSGYITQYDIGGGFVNSSTVTLNTTSTMVYRSLDNAGNTETNKTTGEIKIDKQNPAVANLTVSTTLPAINETLTIRANITDTNNLSTQQLVVINGVNYTMTLESANIYKYDFTPSQAINYSVAIYAKDIAGNYNSTVATAFVASVKVVETDVQFQNDSVVSKDYSSQEKTQLQIATNTSVIGNITVALFSLQPGFVITSLANAIRYVDVNLTENANGNLNWILLKVYYSDSEVSSLNESSLALSWYNTTSGAWVNMTAGSPSWVNGVGVDTTNNYAWANLSHLSLYGLSGSVPSIVTSVVTGGTGSGGGVAGVSNESINIFTNVLAGSTITANISLSNNPLSQVAIIVNTNASSVQINTKPVTTLPAGTSTISVAGETVTVYSYVNITVTGLANTGIQSAKVGFSVPKTWLTSNGFVASDIALYRLESAWSKLTTRVLSENSTSVKFEADTPGFSLFAILATSPIVSNVTTNGTVAAQNCTVGTKRCSGNYIQVCSSNGTMWSYNATCENGCNVTSLACNAAVVTGGQNQTGNETLGQGPSGTAPSGGFPTEAAAFAVVIVLAAAGFLFWKFRMSHKYNSRNNFYLRFST